jgi:hypothetical protein
MAIHALAQPALAVLGEKARLIILRDEVVEIVVGFENDIASAAAIAAAGSALGPVFLALESDAPFPAVPGSGLNFDLIDKHVERKPKL